MNKKRNNSGKSNIVRTDSPLIKVIGFGNIFMGDDGIGIRIIERLRQDKGFKDIDNIELIDGGTSGIDLIFILQQAEKAIIVDSFLAIVDGEKCTGCGDCFEDCPTGIIQGLVAA